MGATGVTRLITATEMREKQANACKRYQISCGTTERKWEIQLFTNQWQLNEKQIRPDCC